MTNPIELSGWHARVTLTDNARGLLQQAAAEDGRPRSPFAELPTLYEVIALVSSQVRSLGTCGTWRLPDGETEVRTACFRAAELLESAAREMANGYADVFPIEPNETVEPTANIYPLRRAA